MNRSQGRVRRRILVVTGIFPNRRNPTWGIHVYQNVRALSAHADVRVVAPVPLMPAFLARGRYRAYAGIARSGRVDGIDVVYPRFFVVPRIGRWAHGFGVFGSILPTVAREVRRFRPQALLAYFAYPYGFAAVLFGMAWRLPVVVSCRGSDVNRMTKPALQGWLIKWSLRRCRRVLVMSNEMRLRVLGWGIDPARLEVLANGVDAERFAPADRNAARRELGITDDARVVVCVSRLSAEKGIDVLVDAMTELDASAQLFVIGDGAERAALAGRVRASGLDARVFLMGTRPHEEIPRWLAAADVVALPSRTEGMPNAVLEALACGRPVVATAVGGTRELVEVPALGRLVPPDDAAALARALREALATRWDPALIARSVSGRTWDEIGARTARALAFEDPSRAADTGGTSPEHEPWQAGTR